MSAEFFLCFNKLKLVAKLKSDAIKHKFPRFSLRLRLANSHANCEHKEMAQNRNN